MKGWAHTKPKPILSKRDFYDDGFHKWGQKQYEEARVHLKNRGRPKDEHDRLLIEEAKFNSMFLKKLITDLDL